MWYNGCNPDASDTVAIIGGGPIGLCASMVCAESGATVIVIDPLEARRENALRYGANLAVDPTAAPVEEQIKELTNGRGADVVIECSGNDVGIASLFDIAGQSARVGVIGHSIGRKVPVEIGKTIWKTMRIAGVAGPERWFPRTIRFMSKIKDKYDFAALNTHHLILKIFTLRLIWRQIIRILPARLCLRIREWKTSKLKERLRLESLFFYTNIVYTFSIL